MRKSLVSAIILVTLFAASALAGEAQQGELKDSTATITDTASEAAQPDQVVVYYLHMNRRCATCEKLEAYSKEAVESGFVEQLKDSSIVFRVENFEQEGNKHFADDYQLFSQSVILSRQHEGEEIEWKSLDKIWELVGNKEEFVAYVQAELTGFLSPATEE